MSESTSPPEPHFYSTKDWFSLNIADARKALTKRAQAPPESSYFAAARDAVAGYLPTQKWEKNAAIHSWMDSVDSTADPWTVSGASGITAQSAFSSTTARLKSGASSFFSSCIRGVGSCFTGWGRGAERSRIPHGGVEEKTDTLVAVPEKSSYTGQSPSSPVSNDEKLSVTTGGPQQSRGRTGLLSYFSRRTRPTSAASDKADTGPRGESSSFWSLFKRETPTPASKIQSAYSSYLSTIESSFAKRAAGGCSTDQWHAEDTAALRRLATDVSKYTKFDRNYHHLMVNHNQKVESDFAEGTATVASELKSNLEKAFQTEGPYQTDAGERTTLAQSILKGALSLNKAVDECRTRDRWLVEQGMDRMIQSLDVMLVKH